MWFASKLTNQVPNLPPRGFWKLDFKCEIKTRYDVFVFIVDLFLKLLAEKN